MIQSQKDYRDDLNYILQTDLLSNFIPRIGHEPWLTVYAIRDNFPNKFTIFSGLLTPEGKDVALKTDSWDIRIGDGLPGFTISWQNNREKVIYYPFGNATVRPLIIVREFYGAWPSYVEICEEFRHFHNFAEDRDRGILFDFDESGYPIEVAYISEHEVKIQLSYLLRFIAAIRLHLAIYFDVIRYSQIPIDNIPKDKYLLEYSDDHCRYTLHIAKCDFYQDYCTFSRLLGKVVLSPPPIEKCGKWPFTGEKEEDEVTFIIGVNPDGTLKEFTSHPDKLSNYFGANPGVPHYLTPVFFRKEVLEKYYAEPDRYSVEDGCLRCLGLWSIQIDNSHPTHVVAFLGDLGRDLPYKERLHWRQFNVPPPPEANISETCFRRSFLAEFAEPESIDLIFRREYQQLNITWTKKMGWPLFLAPKPGDEHLLQTIHVPVTTSQRELDEQILALTKLLIDSLNEKELSKVLPEAYADKKGISKFERFLEAKNFPFTKEVIQFLRDLQTLRSTGVAHRKGSNYKKVLARLGLIGKKGPEVMNNLLSKAVFALQTLHKFLIGMK